MASPASAAKKRKKGWDQVEQICGVLKKTNRFKVVQVLKKKSATGQKMLSLEDRKKNLKGKIHCTLNGASLIQEKNILLIDDVFTTGATADECSSVLKKNGASRVVSLTVAVD
ncbi:ComF family protein [Spirochaeta isovalerica]|uniref:ComF family protein n=1 Tax=Spirochaeta isovalerica TaxID=150 RepID=A0A841R6Z9_9SPIO|nr:ComF family protein [Spirochaeta isovalerica]MBB6478820.1 ComF family protein [Spirochaeta isovalerica]